MFCQESEWHKKGMTWSEWRSEQADLAVHYYLQNDVSMKTVARLFKISMNAVSCYWRFFKDYNGIVGCKCRK